MRNRREICEEIRYSPVLENVLKKSINLNRRAFEYCVATSGIEFKFDRQANLRSHGLNYTFVSQKRRFRAVVNFT